MASPILKNLEDQVKANVDAEASAVILINGFADRLTKAVADALANGATAEELAPVQAEIDGLKASADSLAAAVVANSPLATAKRKP